jgi:sec-independent protein translocase protein TatB
MFDIGWSELLVIGVVALIAIGPKELPGVLRMVGQYMGKVRRMASEFQGQFQEAMREAEMADIKKHVDDITDTAKTYTNFDPLGDISKQFETANEDKPTPGEPAVITPSETAVSQDSAMHDNTAALPASVTPAAQGDVPAKDKPSNVADATPQVGSGA